MPLVTTFAGDSARGEGLFSASSGAPKNKFVYVTNSGYVFKVSTASFTIVSTLSVGSLDTSPMVIDPAGLYGYIIESGTYVTKIDLTTFTVVGSITQANLGGNTAVIDPSGSFLYVGNNNIGVIYKFNLTTFTYVSSLSGFLGYFAEFCIDASGTYLYAITTSAVGIYKINLSTFTITTSSAFIGYGSFYAGLCIDNSNNLYIGSNYNSGSILKFASSNLNTPTTTSGGLPGIPTNVILDNTQSNLYATDQTNSTVSKLPVSLASSSGITITSAFGITCDSLGTYAYATGATGSAATSTIKRITISTFTVSGSIPGTSIGMNAPYGITMDFYTNNPR